MTVLNSTKRGQTPLDGLFIIVMLFVFGILIIWGYSFISDFNDDWQSDTAVSQVSKDVLNTYNDKWSPVWDQAFAWLVGLLWVALILTSFLIDTHPAFFVVTLVVLLIVFALIMELSNQYEDFTSQDEMADFSQDFPMTLWIMDHVLVLSIVMFLSAGIALYAKERL